MELLQLKTFMHKIPLTLYCSLFILLAYFSWCLITISYSSNLFLCISGLINIILMILFFAVVKLSQIPYGIINQLRTIIKIILVTGLLIFIFFLSKAENLADRFISIMCLIWAGWAIWTLMFWWKEKGFISNNTPKRWCDKCKNKIGILFLGVLAILLAYEEVGYQFKWDGLLYYNSCHNASLDSISSLALYGHISQTYAGLVTSLRLMVKDVGMAMIVVNIILLLVAIFSYYYLLKIIIPYKKEFFYFFATAILAFSPFFLGMVNYFSLDYCLICLFPAVLYFTFKEKWIYQLIVGLLFCFTKETAVIIYAGICFGVLIFDVVSKKIKKINIILKTGHYYTMALPCVLWLFTFFLLGPWNAGESAVGINVSYILCKFEILYLFQFNWIFTLAIIIYLFLVLIQKKKLVMDKNIFPLVISQIIFTFFSCIFQTVNHPRYIDSSIVFLYCVGTYCLVKLVSDKWQVLACACVSFILLCASYKSIDFVTNNLFEQIDIGTDKIVSTYDLPFGDGTIYNKQMLWMEGAINKAYGAALENNDIIVVPAIDDFTYAFDGASVVASTEGGYYVQRQFWNELKGRRQTFEEENCIEYNLYHLSNDADITEIPNSQNKNYSYIFAETNRNTPNEGVLKNANIIEEQSYAYRGWVLKRIIVKASD